MKPKSFAEHWKNFWFKMGLSGGGKLSPSECLDEDLITRCTGLFVCSVTCCYHYFIFQGTARKMPYRQQNFNRVRRFLFSADLCEYCKYAGGAGLRTLSMRGAKLGVFVKINFGLSCIGSFQNRRWSYVTTHFSPFILSIHCESSSYSGFV